MLEIDMENSAAKKASFFLRGGDKAVLLIHGITGTPAEMRYLAKALHKAGYTVLCNTLPRHCGTLAELKKVTWQELYEACVKDVKRLTAEFSSVYVGGLSVGALLAVRLAYQYPKEVNGIIALAPTLFYDGWSLPRRRILLNILWHIPPVRQHMLIRETSPHGLKDEHLRDSVAKFYASAKKKSFDDKVATFGSPFFPLACLYQHWLFVNIVKNELSKVKTPIIVLHAREDDMTSLKNAEYLYGKIGSSDKTFVILEDSYHMIVIDKEKDTVAGEVVKFLNTH